jgi:16S rRNA (cytidine1402-2'-O)-methyltransferase
LNLKGTLYLVATPIGNLEDITLRAIRVLGEVDIIAAEDTRQTVKLLNHFEIKKPLISYYEHNKKERGKHIIQLLLEGKNVALVSDAGSPGISDPGEDLVKSAIEHGINVTMLPGPSALIAGLVLSGLPSGRFAFEGFLPMNKKKRLERLNSLKNETRTMVFYEAPHKLIYILKDLLEAFGNRRIALARELTKKFEEIDRCTLEQAIEKYESTSPKGEFVLVLEGCSPNELSEGKKTDLADISIEEQYETYVQQGMQKKEALKKIAESRGISKRDVYNKLFVN